jgi:hypothetical protein
VRADISKQEILVCYLTTEMTSLKHLEEITLLVYGHYFNIGPTVERPSSKVKSWDLRGNVPGPTESGCARVWNHLKLYVHMSHTSTNLKVPAPLFSATLAKRTIQEFNTKRSWVKGVNLVVIKICTMNMESAGSWKCSLQTVGEPWAIACFANVSVQRKKDGRVYHRFSYQWITQ